MLIRPKQNFELVVLQNFSLLRKRHFLNLMAFLYNDEVYIEEKINSYLEKNIIEILFLDGVDGEEGAIECVCVKNLKKLSNINIAKGSLIGDSFEILLNMYKLNSVRDVNPMINKKDWIEFINNTTTTNKKELEEKIRELRKYNGPDARNNLSFIKSNSADIVAIVDGLLVAFKDIYANYTTNAIYSIINGLYHYHQTDENILVLNNEREYSDFERLLIEFYEMIKEDKKKVAFFINLYIAYKNKDGLMVKEKLKRLNSSVFKLIAEEDSGN